MSFTTLTLSQNKKSLTPSKPRVATGALRGSTTLWSENGQVHLHLIQKLILEKSGSGSKQRHIDNRPQRSAGDVTTMTTMKTAPAAAGGQL